MGALLSLAALITVNAATNVLQLDACQVTPAGPTGHATLTISP